MVFVIVAVLQWPFSPADGKSVQLSVCLPGWRVKWVVFIFSPPTVAGWQVKGIQGTIPYGGGWACWIGWLRPTQCGCCWESVKRRPATYCSDSHQGWGDTILGATVTVSPSIMEERICFDICFNVTGVSGREVSRSAEKGSVCASPGGSARNSHQPLPCQREPVQ